MVSRRTRVFHTQKYTLLSNQKVTCCILCHTDTYEVKICILIGENKKKQDVSGINLFHPVPYCESFGGGGENRTRVQKLSATASTCVSNSFRSYRQPCKLAMPVAGQLLCFASDVTTPSKTSSYAMSLLSVSRPGLRANRLQRLTGLRRRERNAHRWRLYFCKWFSEETTPRHASNYLIAPVETMSPPQESFILHKIHRPINFEDPKRPREPLCRLFDLAEKR